MSLYPSAPDIFVDRDGEDPIASSDPNNAYDAIENIENFLGASGEPQSKLATLVNVFRYMFQPLPQCSWVDADTIAILPSSAVLFATNNFVIKRNTSILTCCLSLHLDTGSEIASSWYDLYLVGDGANSLYTAKFALQGSAITGVTYSKRINSFRNDGSSNLLRFYQTGHKMHPVNVHLDANQLALNAGSSTSFATVTATNCLPNIASLASFEIGVSGIVQFFLRITGSGAGTGLICLDNASGINTTLEDFPVIDGQYDYRVNTGNVTMYIKNYTINV